MIGKTQLPGLPESLPSFLQMLLLRACFGLVVPTASEEGTVLCRV